MSSRPTHPLWRQCFLFYLGFWPLNSFLMKTAHIIHCIYYDIYIFKKDWKCTLTVNCVHFPITRSDFLLPSELPSFGMALILLGTFLRHFCSYCMTVATDLLAEHPYEYFVPPHPKSALFVRDLVRVTVNSRSCSENQSGNFCFLTWHAILEPLEDGWTWSATMLE